MEKVTKLILNGIVTENPKVANKLITEYNQRLNDIKSVFEAVIDGAKIMPYEKGAEPYMTKKDLVDNPNYAEIREWTNLDLTGFEDVDARIDNIIDTVCKAVATCLYGIK